VVINVSIQHINAAKWIDNNFNLKILYKYNLKNSNNLKFTTALMNVIKNCVNQLYIAIIIIQSTLYWENVAINPNTKAQTKLCFTVS
jgi:hypothetical protein